MKLVIVPPYRGAEYDFRPDEGVWYQEILSAMRAQGQLEGVEVDIDPGVEVAPTGEMRNEELFALMQVGVLQRVRELSTQGKYDALVMLGVIDIGFAAAQLVAAIPIAYPLHSAVHMASYIGERFCLIDIGDQLAMRQRRLVRSYGLDHKLASVRTIGRTSVSMMRLLRDASHDGRAANPVIQEVLDEVITQCCAAIEQERVDTLIVGFTPLQCLEVEIRQRLDARGYDEIPIVWSLPATVAMAKAMVEMRLMPATRAYPSEGLKAIPDFR